MELFDKSNEQSIKLENPMMSFLFKSGEYLWWKILVISGYLPVLGLYVYVHNLITITRTCISTHSMFQDSQLTFPMGNVEELHSFYITEK